jgi:competence protein ComEA
VTSSERKALAFLSAVAALGGVARGVSGVADAPPPPSARQALARQIQAVDSAQRAESRSRARRGARGAGRAGADGVGAPRPPDARRRPASGPTAGARVDLDVASAAEIEALPRIGPALAGRIVADRESLGAFGSLAGLERVRGVGPGLAAAVRPYVTFSGTPRPTNAARRGRLRSARPQSPASSPRP